MSGHNPHGRLGQPNASWNHLQVPSFLPRQPQLAHVHVNDSLLRSSPLNWQSDTALYNYAIAAAAATQHKTPLELNPLLPAFVRPPVVNSFGSVDLSFPSHARHNSTPSPHNTNNTSIPNSISPPLEFSSSLQFPLKPALNSLCPVPMSTSLKDVTSNIVNGDKVSSNNVNLNDKLVNYDSVSASNLATGLFVAHQLNNDLTKSAWAPPPTHTEPIELIKETVKIFKNALMNEIIERNSTIDQTSFPNHSPSTSLTDLSNSTRKNNANTQRLLEIPSPIHGNTSNSHNTSRDSLATTSNDESLDSNCGKKRRRRKPNKTCRLSNNEIDEEILSNNNKHLESPPINSFVDPTNARVKLINEPCELKKNPELENQVNSVQIANENKTEDSTSGSLGKIVESESFVPVDISKIVENSVIADNDKSIIVNNPLEPLSSPATRHRRSISRITSPIELSQEHSSNCSSTSIQRRPGKRKLDTDDCETIDKIAAMIASSSPGFNTENGRSTPVPLNENLPSTENGNLKDILETADDHVDHKDNRFEDVEIKLEEMFAGIDDDQTTKNTKLPGCREVRVALKNLPDSSLEKVTPKSGKKKNKKVMAKRDVSSSSADETNHKTKKNVKRLPKSKLKKGANKKQNKAAKGNSTTDNKKSKIKEEIPDTTSKFKGPFIHVRNDGSSNVVNAPITEEVAEQKSKIKKTFVNQNQNDRHKIRGLHVSTLSMKYDAATTDKTWMCVFCKMGPHKLGLGDLFGPYILSTTSEDFALSQIDPNEDVFKSKKTKFTMIQRRSLPTGATGVTAATGNQKRKRKATEPIASTSLNSSINAVSSGSTNDEVDIFYGMTKAADNSYEVWVHGDCAVWSSGVHLIGTRIVGLDAAVWGSSRHQCSECRNYGAMLCCFKRGCNDVAHIPCARKANWSLCDDDFKVLCDKHCEKVDNTISNIVKPT